jgi:uncharacterized OB-fold protein
MSSPAYPQPKLTPTNAPLIEGWQRGELVLQHCADCREIIFFPRNMCPRCWSTDLAWTRSTGRGKIVSFARVYKHVTAPFAAEAPTVLAEIALAGGGVMMARVATGVPASITSGMEVELVPMPEAAQFPLPTFRPVA